MEKNIVSKYMAIFVAMAVLTGCSRSSELSKDDKKTSISNENLQYIEESKSFLGKTDIIKASVSKGVDYEGYAILVNEFKTGYQGKETYLSTYYIGIIKEGLERTARRWKERLGGIGNSADKDFDQGIETIWEKECFPYIDKAKETLRDEGSLEPQKVWLQTVERLLETKNYEEAARITETGIKIYPEDNSLKEKNEIASKTVAKIESHFSKGEDLLYKSDYKGAIVELNKVLEIVPDYIDASALIQIANDRNAEVQKTLAEAKSLYENKKYKKALEKYKMVLEMAPGNESARTGLDAMEKIMKEGASIPDSDMDTYMEGRTESVSIKLVSGIELTGIIVKRTSEEIVVKTNVGTIKCATKDILAETTKLVSDAEVLTPAERYKKKYSHVSENDAAGHYMLWLFCFKNALNNQAEEEYLKAINIDESYERITYEAKARIFYDGAYGLYQQEKWDHAKEMLDKIISDFLDSKIHADAKLLLDTCLDKLDREQWLQSHMCKTCSGSGKCSSCNGSGKVKCNVCNGSGIGKIVEEPGPKCLICEGKGYQIIREERGSSSGYGSGSTNVGSGTYKRSKKCEHCSGRGRLSGRKVEVACEYCLRTGKIKCQVCNGTGVCQTCSGKGYTGVPPESAPPKVVSKELEKPRLCWGCRGAGYYNWPQGDETVRKVCRFCRGIGYLP
ncbi:MAG: hypothetical protein HY606_06010 [Planctomycetes bacterium]|nr:hypothetical protein [Planctomycetota bacterium]